MKVSKEKERSLKGQYAAIWRNLRAGIRMTGLDGLKHAGSMKLSTRIGELESKLGIQVKRGWLNTPTGKRVREYWL